MKRIHKGKDYKESIIIKLKNKRIQMTLLNDGDYYIHFKRLLSYKKIKCTNIKLSEEALACINIGFVKLQSEARRKINN